MTERKRNENRFGRKTFFRFYFYFIFDFNKFITNKPDGLRAWCFPPLRAGRSVRQVRESRRTMPPPPKGSGDPPMEPRTGDGTAEHRRKSTLSAFPSRPTAIDSERGSAAIGPPADRLRGGYGARGRAIRKSRHGAVWIHAAHCRIAPFEANSRSPTGRSYRIPESWRSHRRQCRCANGERVPFRQDRWRGLRHPHPC